MDVDAHGVDDAAAGRRTVRGDGMFLAWRRAAEGRAWGSAEERGQESGAKGVTACSRVGEGSGRKTHQEGRSCGVLRRKTRRRRQRGRARYRSGSGQKCGWLDKREAGRLLSRCFVVVNEITGARLPKACLKRARLLPLGEGFLAGGLCSWHVVKPLIFFSWRARAHMDERWNEDHKRDGDTKY